MADDAIRLFRMLVEAGAKPGEDFSYDLQTESAQISDQAFEKLKSAYPEVDWASICERVEIDPALPAEYLNSYLGVDFVDRILTRIEQRMEALPPAETAWYLQQVLGGVEARTQVSLYTLLQRRLPLARQARLEKLLRQPAVPCYLWMADLIDAAGGNAADIEVEGEEVTLTRHGLALLTAVWDGEYELLEEDGDR
ncbi:MAG: hypothetical protein AAFQ74_00310 [Cyanobacteria bacterium J06623_4]